MKSKNILLLVLITFLIISCSSDSENNIKSIKIKYCGEIDRPIETLVIFQSDSSYYKRSLYYNDSVGISEYYITKIYKFITESKLICKTKCYSQTKSGVFEIHIESNELKQCFLLLDKNNSAKFFWDLMQYIESLESKSLNQLYRLIEERILRIISVYEYKEKYNTNYKY